MSEDPNRLVPVPAIATHGAAVAPPAQSPLGMVHSWRRLLKRLWRASPRFLREMPLRLLSMLFLPGRTSAASLAPGPQFVVGPLTEPSGIGNGARMHIAQGLAANEDIRPVDSTGLFRDPNPRLCPFAVEGIKGVRVHRGSGTVVIHANPPHFLIILLHLGAAFLRGKTVVAYWVWELDDIPALWRFALRFVNRIVVPSHFVAGAIRRHTDKPVTVIPYPMTAVPQSVRVYASGGITRVLFMFDIGSRISRKNPFGAIKAFKRAFADRSDVSFTLKISPAPGFESEVERLVSEVSGDSRLILLNKVLDQVEIEELYRTHDIYLSLHRSEGYGLTIREAMQHGLQVVATGWSGNVDFMRGPRVYPVAYRLIPVMEDQEIFSVPQATWADPDVEQAASTVREIDRARRAGEEPRVPAEIPHDGSH